jgi:carboxyl-terminal processing protease
LAEGGESTIKVEKKEEIEKGKDEGGIVPNIVMEGDRSSRYGFELERQNLFFKFAVNYFSKHNEISKDFRATDEILRQFKTFLDAQKFTYETASELELDRLRKLAKEEGFEEGIESAIALLEKEIEKEKAKDFEKNREYIVFVLEREILSKAYGTEGAYIALLRNDSQVQAATDLLRDPAKYRQGLEARKMVATAGQKG